MSSQENPSLSQSIAVFQQAYAPRLLHLAQRMNEAGISHYSSNNGARSVTFQLFPAAPYVEEILAMVSLERPHKQKIFNGFKDAATYSDYNPGVLFLHYLQRWSRFAEQVMHQEGDRPHGVAAACAKLIMDELFAELNRIPAGASKAQSRLSPFAIMMRDIGVTLEKREKVALVQAQESQQATTQRNYLRALEAAKLSASRSFHAAAVADLRQAA